MFWQVILATYLSRENRVFCKMSSFSTLFSKRVSICLSCILWLFTFWSYFQYFNITVVISKIFHHFVTILSIFKERYGFCPLLFIFHCYCLFLMDFVLYLVFIYLLTMFVFLSVWCFHFLWLSSDPLYIVATLGHYCPSFLISSHVHLALRVFFIIHNLKLTHC